MYEITYLKIDENTEYEKTVKKVLEKCFEEEGLMDSKLIITVTFTNPEEIRKINKKYRKIDKATDVLSFPMFEKEELELYAEIAQNAGGTLNSMFVPSKDEILQIYVESLM